MMSDKNIEIGRYDKRAAKLLALNDKIVSADFASYLRSPIDSYENLLCGIPLGSNVLEIGAGMVQNTEDLLKLGLEVSAIDISSKSVEVLENKFSGYDLFSAEVADMEALPFKDNSFNVVCSAGSLSYGDNLIVLKEIHRVLKKGGQVIVMDSLNNNPIYKLNRYIHFLLGKRSKSTLKRMPNVDLIGKYEKHFGNVDVTYFGSLTWMFTFLSKFLSNETIRVFSDNFDKRFNIKKSAFKFTMRAIKL